MVASFGATSLGQNMDEAGEFGFRIGAESSQKVIIRVRPGDLECTPLSRNLFEVRATRTPTPPAGAGTRGCTECLAKNLEVGRRVWLCFFPGLCSWSTGLRWCFRGDKMERLPRIGRRCCLRV
jgi:hypothetical protein